MKSSDGSKNKVGHFLSLHNFPNTLYYNYIQTNEVNMKNENSQYVDINDFINPPSKTPSELYEELGNLQQLVTYLSD